MMIKAQSIFLFTLILSACSLQSSERTILGKSYAERELKSALAEKIQHNVINDTTVIIKDSLTAINVTEPVLFSIYGKENITTQRPYEVYFIENFWIVKGTLPKGYNGGTFLIILDARNNRIIRVTHGK